MWNIEIQEHERQIALMSSELVQTGRIHVMGRLDLSTEGHVHVFPDGRAPMMAMLAMSHVLWLATKSIHANSVCQQACPVDASVILNAVMLKRI